MSEAAADVFQSSITKKETSQQQVVPRSGVDLSNRHTFLVLA
jgi:hypothetical protein